MLAEQLQRLRCNVGAVLPVDMSRSLRGSPARHGGSSVEFCGIYCESVVASNNREKLQCARASCSPLELVPVGGAELAHGTP